MKFSLALGAAIIRRAAINGDFTAVSLLYLLEKFTESQCRCTPTLSGSDIYSKFNSTVKCLIVATLLTVPAPQL